MKKTRAVPDVTRPTFFKTADDLRAWLEKNHGRATELLVGYYKVDSGARSITWAESVDEALCFGWIDGKRKRLDEKRYTIRFSPRTKGSNWSVKNVRRVHELEKEGRMHAAGRAVFDARLPRRDRFAYEERKSVRLDHDLEARFRAARKAYRFFERQPPSMRQLTVFYIMNAKQQRTRERRLVRIIERFEHGLPVDPMGPVRVQARKPS